MSGVAFQEFDTSTELDQVSLEDLTRRSQHGDSVALEALCLGLLPTLKSAAYRYERNPDAREDHVQTGMERFLRSYVLREPDENGEVRQFTGNAAALAAMITRNAIYDAHRREINADGIRREINDGEHILIGLHALNNPEDEVVHGSTNPIDNLLESLKCSDEIKETVRLRYVHDLSVEEVATITNSPNGTVLSRSKRGLEHIKKYAQKINTPVEHIFDAMPERVAAQ